MVQSLEQYIAEASNAYKPASTAIQSQLDSLAGQLETANQQINRNYAQQQAQLESQRNQAAESASLQAAGSGGSFGGSANLANRKYYERSFVPAQTQLQTNQANELAQARQNYDNQRTNLNSQLSQLQAQANQAALQQYWAAQEAEKQLAAQRAMSSASNSAARAIMDAMKNSKGASYTLSPTRNMYGGFDWTDANGNKHKASTVAAAAGGNFNDALWEVLSQAGAQGDYYSQEVAKELQNGHRFVKNTGAPTGNAMYDTLGIKRADMGGAIASALNKAGGNLWQ